MTQLTAGRIKKYDVLSYGTTTEVISAANTAIFWLHFILV
jgi:hypothetical protein